MKKTIEITATLEELQIMYQNDQVWWGIPDGYNHIYKANRPSWMYDKVIARPSDFEEELGFSIDSEFDDDDELRKSYTIKVELPK